MGLAHMVVVGDNPKLLRSLVQAHVERGTIALVAKYCAASAEIELAMQDLVAPLKYVDTLLLDLEPVYHDGCNCNSSMATNPIANAIATHGESMVEHIRLRNMLVHAPSLQGVVINSPVRDLSFENCDFSTVGNYYIFLRTLTGCRTLRSLAIHHSIYDEVQDPKLEKLCHALAESNALHTLHITSLHLDFDAQMVAHLDQLAAAHPQLAIIVSGTDDQYYEVHPSFRQKAEFTK